MMRRTQLYLDEEKYHFLKMMAKSKNKSMSEFIREIIDFYIKDFREKDSFCNLIGITDVEEDIASSYEDYLYGYTGTVCSWR